MFALVKERKRNKTSELRSMLIGESLVAFLLHKGRTRGICDLCGHQPLHFTHTPFNVRMNQHLTKDINTDDKKYRYQIQCARSVSGITFSRYAQGQKTTKSNNLTNNSKTQDTHTVDDKKKHTTCFNRLHGIPFYYLSC